MLKQIKITASHFLSHAKDYIKWSIFALIVGLVMGCVGTAFYYCMDFVTDLRTANSWMIFFLPFGGLFIVWSYHMLKNDQDTGTNLVLSAIHSGDNLPLRQAPLIFIATVITHAFGGSSGREGAALQLGGSIGNGLGKLFRFDEKDKHIMIMCGMSAAFSALFGTPMAAAIFSMEVVSVGIMHYSALVPCVISALVARGIASTLGVSSETFLTGELPAFTIQNALIVIVLAILCSLVSIFFCIVLHESEHLYKRFFKNPYLRVFVGGLIVIGLTLLVGNNDYNGAGFAVIEECMNGEVFALAFLLKIIFTAATLGCGFKGGEIVPSLFIGASFGCLFANLFSLSAPLCSAVGMGAVFCGVTNCPITSLLLCFALFGYEGMPYFLLAVALSYMLSGYYGLYSSQKIIYSKYKTQYINRKTH